MHVYIHLYVHHHQDTDLLYDRLLRGVVDSMLDFCALPQCAFSVKELFFNVKGAGVRPPPSTHTLTHTHLKETAMSNIKSLTGIL